MHTYSPGVGAYRLHTDWHSGDDGRADLEVCIENDEFRTEDDEFRIENDEFRTENDEFRIEDDEFRIENDEYLFK